MSERVYLAIDLKSFYASVECIRRNLDPLTTNLVVADESRTEKTICLAVTPSLKAYGIPGRARLFEVIQKVREINARRLLSAPGHVFAGSSWRDPDVRANPSMELSYLVAPPRMALYMEESARVYQVYLEFLSPEQIHPYSIDEVLMDVTDYTAFHRCSPRALAERILQRVREETGLTATAGIGTNLYLAKVAMDIVAKHIPPDADGVRIAELDELSYRKLLWEHRPLTDFWRVGRGSERRLQSIGLFTMGDVARCSLSQRGEDSLYRLFGVNAELLIDHAWGWEPCTMEAIKAWRPETHSICSGQVLSCPYDFEGGKLIVREMAELLSMDLVAKDLAADQVTLTVGYDRESLASPELRGRYAGPTERNHYGVEVPKSAHGTASLPRYTSSARLITRAVTDLYDRIVHPDLLVRRVTLAAGHVVEESGEEARQEPEQLSLFDTPAEEKPDEKALERERRMQKAVLAMQQKYGKNAILRGMNLLDGATTRDRNRQIGGHRA